MLEILDRKSTISEGALEAANLVTLYTKIQMEIKEIDSKAQSANEVRILAKAKEQGKKK